MKQFILLFALLFYQQITIAQTKISGIVISTNGQQIAGANISIAKTYDGSSTDTAGRFSFVTSEQGKQLLKFSAVGHKPDSLWIDLKGKTLSLELKLKEMVNDLNQVTISAGTLETGDYKKGAVLSSLDIATTAGAVADIVAALQTLPGTAQAFGENGLFVRGGSGAETQTYFDGMIVKSPFGSQLPDIASRNRFSTFLFKGTTFSSGGYSAQYGQALSAALLMETKDMPEKSSTELSLLSVGLSATKTIKMKKSALIFGGNYYNLQPVYAVVKQNINWDKAPIDGQANIQYKLQPTKNGMFKFFGQFNRTQAALKTGPEQMAVTNSNNNYFFNSTYQDYLNNDWKVQAGISYSRSKELGGIQENDYSRFDELTQGRFSINRYLNGRSLIRTGAEVYFGSREDRYNTLSRSFDNDMQAAFTEGEFYIGDNLVARAGARMEHSSYIADWNIAPRLSLGIKAGKRGQVSLAYGTFYQNPDDAYLIQSKNLDYEKADHYLLNYQFLNEGITFRAEAYYKKYSSLTTYDFAGYAGSYGVNNYSNLGNGGSGYSKGVDLFFRDKKSIPAGDYWISYSFVDSKRDFRNYPSVATPPFAAKHTLNIVYKQYIPYLKSEVGTTYSFSSGRTFYNPNNAQFLSDKTKSFHNLSLNVSYLTSVFKQFAVLYASATNLPGFKNIYGYNYSVDGSNRQAITPASKRNFFVGLIITIGDNTFNR
ncbi:MAG: TonB-dependent receptor [Pedobacter sp.]|nr:MAG: TonB-dependent receptor [Pedobacter sp.]